MTCDHCGGDLIADRTGDGVRVLFGRDTSFVLSAHCPYPRCARIVCARARDAYRDSGAMTATTMNEAVAWSPRAVAAAAFGWSWLVGLVAAFSAIPAIGLGEAFESLRCGGIAWLLFLGGSLLALVPVIYFVRGLGCGAHDALRCAARARASVRAGETGGLILRPDPRTYRSP